MTGFRRLPCILLWCLGAAPFEPGPAADPVEGARRFRIFNLDHDPAPDPKALVDLLVETHANAVRYPAVKWAIRLHFQSVPAPSRIPGSGSAAPDPRGRAAWRRSRCTVRTDRRAPYRTGRQRGTPSSEPHRQHVRDKHTGKLGRTAHGSRVHPAASGREATASRSRSDIRKARGAHNVQRLLPCPHFASGRLRVPALELRVD